ncbi:MAG: DUF5666 domain-containing protein [Parvularculaceae bacterium]
MKSRHLLMTVCAAALAGCGGSGDGPAPAPQTPPPASVSSTLVSSSGTITGFGSVFVNGVKYEVENGTIVAIEDETETAGDDSGLRVGMRVNIAATETNGVRTATRIEFDEDLKGFAENIVSDAADPAIGVFTVAGQTVTVDVNTIFDDDIGDNDAFAGIDIRDLDPANFGGNPIIVEISGFPTDAGILATRIDRVNAATLGAPGVDGDELEVKGFVDAVAPGGGSFDVNGATFIVNGGTQFDSGLFANDALVGVFVEVKADINAMGDYIAVRVEREDDFGDRRNNAEFEIEGILQSVDTSSNPDVIVINGVTIEVSNASSLLNRVGLRVEVKGTFNASGVLVIGETKLEAENNIRTEDRVASINSSSGSFTTRLGLVIAPTESARIDDDVSGGGDHLTPAQFISRLMVNNYIRARGFPDGADISWTRIEREDKNETECRLRGPVEAGSISDPTFVIEGVTIDTTGLGFGGFEDEEGADIGRAAFFAGLAAGDVVEAKSDDNGVGCVSGRLSTGAIGEVEFEDDDGVAGNGPGNGGAAPGAAAEVAGVVSALETAGNTFAVAGRTVAVVADTLIDASIVEAARGIQLGDADLRFGDLPETLDQLLSDGDPVKVTLNANGEAILIEDF